MDAAEREPLVEGNGPSSPDYCCRFLKWLAMFLPAYALLLWLMYKGNLLG